MKMTCLKFSSVPILFLWVNTIHNIIQEGNAVADNAAYFIKNVQDGLCITAGPIVDNDKVTIFQSGIVISANCSGSLGQEWILTTKDTKDHTPMYEFRVQNVHAFNKLLNAEVRGEFIKYFNNLVQVQQIHLDKKMPELEKLISPAHTLYVEKSNKCFESMGENHVLHLADCNNSSLSQRWILTLVNQAHAAGTLCSSFWQCNP